MQITVLGGILYRAEKQIRTIQINNAEEEGTVVISVLECLVC